MNQLIDDRKPKYRLYMNGNKTKLAYVYCNETGEMVEDVVLHYLHEGEIIEFHNIEDVVLTREV